ncbi:hypothetical protein EWH96_09335, partial [Enterococcus faecium]
LSQNVVHSDSDLILHNSSVLIDKEPQILPLPETQKSCGITPFSHSFSIFYFVDSRIINSVSTIIFLETGALELLN